MRFLELSGGVLVAAVFVVGIIYLATHLTLKNKRKNK